MWTIRNLICLIELYIEQSRDKFAENFDKNIIEHQINYVKMEVNFGK